jgi:hypothetical protein
MSRETKICLGRRKSFEWDKSCNFGVAFGDVVAEIEQFDVTLCYMERTTSNVLSPMVDLVLLFISDTSLRSDYAYRNIPKEIALRLERTLRQLINREMLLRDYNLVQESIKEELLRLEKNLQEN